MQEMFEIIRQSTSGSITQSPVRILFNLSMALILGFVYSYVYKLTYTGKKNDIVLKNEMKGIQYTLILLSVGGAFIWIVVADNLVRAFGLAGALSLIRFRTVVKDPSNTVKVFYAIIIGMSCGLSQYYAAIIGTVFMCLVLALLYYINKYNKSKKKSQKASVLTKDTDEL
jgi:preprotein translocase subunit SecY